MEKGGTDFRPVFHKPLTESKPWPTWLGFLDDGLMSFHEVEDAVVIDQGSSGTRENSLRFTGQLEDLHYLPALRLVLLLSQDQGSQTLVADSLEGRPVLRILFQAKDVLFRAGTETFILGVDQSLLSLRLRYQ